LLERIDPAVPELRLVIERVQDGWRVALTDTSVDADRQALEIEFLKRGAEKRTTAEKRDYIRHHRPDGISIAEGYRLMGLPRSTYYDAPAVKAEDGEIMAAMTNDLR
jgi:hypothetical protein